MSVIIQHQSFSPYEVLQDHERTLFVTHAGKVGAANHFIGTMRDFNEGSDVTGLTLEYYPGMTEKVLQNLCERHMAKYGCLDIVVHHRVGEIQRDEAIVLVAVWSSHRAEAFAACQSMMEALKSEAPFWKKETLQSNETRWVAKNTSGVFG
jgi:molybdopterin synthase catalytic subunit